MEITRISRRKNERRKESYKGSFHNLQIYEITFKTIEFQKRNLKIKFTFSYALREINQRNLFSPD